MRLFSQRALQINSAGMIPLENHPPQPAHIHWNPTGKAHSKRSECTRMENTTDVWDRGKNFHISKGQETEPLRPIGCVGASWLNVCTGWQIIQTMNELNPFNKWLSPPECITFYSVECPLIISQLMCSGDHSGDSEPNSMSYNIYMKSIK